MALPQSLVDSVNNTSFMPPLGEEGIATKIALINNASAEWLAIHNRIARNHELLRGNLWTVGERQQIEAQGRLPVELPVIEPLIRNLIGRQMALKTEFKLYPAPGRARILNPELEMKCSLAESALNGIAQANAWSESDEGYVVLDSCCGIGWASVQESTTLEGKTELTLQREDWRDIMYDPGSRRPDLKDANWLRKITWRTIPEAMELYPDKADVIERSRGQQSEDTIYPLRFQTANMTSYDESRIPIIEFYERRRFLVYSLIDPNNSDNVCTDFMSEQDAQAEFDKRTAQYQMAAQQAQIMMAQQAAQMGEPPSMLNAPQPEPLTITPHWEPRIVQTCFIRNELLDENMYECELFPFVPYFQFYDAGCDTMMFWGLVDILAAPQLLLNRTLSQVDYMMGTAIKNMIVVNEQALSPGFTKENLAAEVGKTAPIFTTPGQPDQFLKTYPMGTTPQSYMEFVQAIRSIIDTIMPFSSFAAPLPGGEGGVNNQSGRALALQGQVAEAGLASIFTRLRFSHQQIGELLLYNLQTNTDEPSLIQYLGKDGALQWIELNSTPENSIYEERFIVTVSDQGYSPSARAIQNQQINGLLQNQAVIQLAMNPMCPPWVFAVIKAEVMSMDLPIDVKMEIAQLLVPAQLPMGAPPPNQPAPAGAQGNPNPPMPLNAQEQAGTAPH